MNLDNNLGLFLGAVLIAFASVDLLYKWVAGRVIDGGNSLGGDF